MLILLLPQLGQPTSKSTSVFENSSAWPRLKTLRQWSGSLHSVVNPIANQTTIIWLQVSRRLHAYCAECIQHIAVQCNGMDSFHFTIYYYAQLHYFWEGFQFTIILGTYFLYCRYGLSLTKFNDQLNLTDKVKKTKRKNHQFII